MSVFPTLKTSYKNDLDLIEKILMCYSIMQDKPLRKFEMTVLKYYNENMVTVKRLKTILKTMKVKNW